MYVLGDGRRLPNRTGEYEQGYSSQNASWAIGETPTLRPQSVDYPVFFIPAAMPLTVSRRVRSSASVRWVWLKRCVCSRLSGST